jgi:hypothetical protein
VTLILAGLVAAITAGIARAFFNPRANLRSFGLVWLAFFAVLFFVSWLYVPPWMAQRGAQAHLEQLHWYRLLREHDPETFQALKVRVGQLTNRLRSRDEAALVAQRELMKVVMQKISTAPDDAVLEYFHVYLSNMKELRERGDDACHRLILSSRNLDPGVNEILPEAMVQTTGDALVKVLRATRRAPQKVPKAVDVIPHMTPILEQLKVEYADDMPLLANPEGAVGAQRRRTCEVAIGIQSRFLELPPRQASMVLRYMAASRGP